YDSSVSESSLPMARCHTAPRQRGVIPRHHSARMRGSVTARSQSGNTCSSHMRWSVSRVLSFSHWAEAALAALRFSASRLVTHSIHPIRQWTNPLPVLGPSSFYTL
ncbi:hypothetical protein T310_5867, partial [Rasamsonia emersonii CBS 393.64]